MFDEPAHMPLELVMKKPSRPATIPAPPPSAEPPPPLPPNKPRVTREEFRSMDCCLCSNICPMLVGVIVRRLAGHWGIWEICRRYGR
jgi:hypothetical protein